MNYLFIISLLIFVTYTWCNPAYSYSQYKYPIPKKQYYYNNNYKSQYYQQQPYYRPLNSQQHYYNQQPYYNQQQQYYTQPYQQSYYVDYNNPMYRNTRGLNFVRGNVPFNQMKIGEAYGDELTQYWIICHTCPKGK